MARWCALLALALPLVEVGSVRPEVMYHSGNHGQDAVLVTVNTQFFGMFKNWLYSAKPFLEGRRLFVVAEDSQVVKPLEPLIEQLQGEIEITLSRGVIDLPGSPKGHGSEEYGLIVGQTPQHILNLLQQGFSVLYVDVDTVWQKDPFLEINAANGAELYVITDHPGGARPFCGCFMYAHPVESTIRLMETWAEKMQGETSNQGVFNDWLGKLQQSSSSKVSVVELPIHQFPNGAMARVENTENATVIHANYLKGMEKKIDFFQQRGAWKPEALERELGLLPGAETA